MPETVVLDALQTGGGTAAGGTMLGTLLALSAMLLALSVAVQIVQEIFKFLRSSPSRVYTEVLTDGLGGWIEQLARPSSRLPLARGPFQFFRSKPGVLLLPLSKEQLKNAVDILAPDWIAIALESLKAEVELQAGKPAPASEQLRQTLARVREATEDAADAGGAWNARSIDRFFGRWTGDAAFPAERDDLDEDAALDAAKVLRDFYREFLPQRRHVEERFDQLQTNYQWTYRRHNLRLTFVFALLIAFFLNLPFDGLLKRASSMTPEQAVALAERAQALAEKAGVAPSTAPGDEEQPGQVDSESEPAAEGAESPAKPADTEREKLLRLRDQALEAIELAQPAEGGLMARLASARESWWPSAEQEESAGFWKRLGNSVRTGLPGFASHLAQCLLTALLVCFGAPFWDRITKLLLRANRPATTQEAGA